MTTQNLGNDLSVAGTGGSQNAALDLDRLDLDALLNLEGTKLIAKKSSRGRKGQASALIEKLLAGETLLVHIVDNLPLVERIRQKGEFAYTELGALTNALNKRVNIDKTWVEPDDPVKAEAYKKLGIKLLQIRKA